MQHILIKAEDEDILILTETFKRLGVEYMLLAEVSEQKVREDITSGEGNLIAQFDKKQP